MQVVVVAWCVNMKWPGHRDVRTQFVGVCTVYCFIEGDKFSTIKCKKSLMVTIYCFCWELEQPIRALSIWIVGPDSELRSSFRSITHTTALQYNTYITQGDDELISISLGLDAVPAAVFVPVHVLHKYLH